MKKKLAITILALVLCLCAAVCLTACDKDQELESLYKPTNIKYDGARITWDRVTLAEHYTVSINGGEAKRVNTNMYTYETDAKEFDVTVSSVIKGKSFGVDRHFTELDSVTSISVSDTGELTWEAVAGATAYRISVNGTTLPDDIYETRYVPKVGNSLIKIKPIVSGDDSYFSTWSSEKQLNILEAPQSIDYDGEYITWRGNASKYEVLINGTSAGEYVSGSKLAYSFVGKQMTVSVKAVGNHATSFDSASTEKTYYMLDTVKNINVVDGVLQWDAVDGAEGYRIKINNYVQNILLKNNSYDGLKPNELQEVEIKPYNNGGNYFSNWSRSERFQILSAPVINWNTAWNPDAEEAATKNIFWDSVGNEYNYTVEVSKDGRVIDNQDVTEPQYGNAYLQSGKYTVKVRANAEAGGAWSSSKFSAPIEVIRLEGPKKSGNDYIKSDASDLSKGFIVSYLKVANASRYQLYRVNGENKTPIEGAVTTRDSLQYNQFDSETAQIYNYLVKSEGDNGVKNVNGVKQVVLSCTDESALSFTVSLRAMPSKPIVEGMKATWSGGGENGCSIRCDSRTLSADSETVTDISFLKAGRHELSVCANGNGSNVLPSKFTPAVSVIRLETPTGIKIFGGASDGQLTHGKVENADSYVVYFNGSDSPVKVTELHGISEYIRANGTSVQVQAKANTNLNTENLYYIDSEKSVTQQFICLTAPSFGNAPFDEEMVNLRWNAPSNVTSAYTPNYRVYDMNSIIGQNLQAASLNIESLAVGAHTLEVQAKGDGEKFLDSERSNPLQVEKLETPTLKIADNMFTWEIVDKATSYSLSVDGNNAAFELQSADGSYRYDPVGKLTAIKTYVISLFAKGDGRTTINSGKLTFNQTVKQCIAPEISYKYSTEQVTHGGTIDITITKPSPNNNGYYYEIGGAGGKFDSFVSVPAENSGAYAVRAKALGGSFENIPLNGVINEAYNGVFYIDSQYTNPRTITLLGSPTTFEGIDITSVISWNVVRGALGYDVQISLNGGEYSSIIHAEAAQLKKDKYLPEGKKHTDYKTIKFRVRASGDGVNSVTSEWREFVWTNPVNPS